MANDTQITVVGNLTADPELRYTDKAVAVAKFTVASTPRVYDKTTGEYRDGEPLYLVCTAWRELAEHVSESLAKGARVVATGRLRQSRWETEDGEKRSAYGLDVDDVGPSLRFATATINRLSRRGGWQSPDVPPDDTWATASPIRPESTPDLVVVPDPAPLAA